MMAQDKNGLQVEIGDYMAAAFAEDEPWAAEGDRQTVVRIVAMSEGIKREGKTTVRNVQAKGAWVAMEGGGVVKKFTFNPATAILVMKANGQLVSDAKVLPVKGEVK